MFDFSITADTDPDNPIEFTTTSRDVLVWEKTTRGANLKVLTETASMVSLYQLAYLAAERLGLVDCSQSEFEATYDLSVANKDSEDTEDADPTQ